MRIFCVAARRDRTHDARMDDQRASEPVRIPITGELDLHTFRPEDVSSLLEAYFAEAGRLGLREVRVIHGKGTGTLRAGVLAWLRRSPRVAGWRTGDAGSGGWGATLVTLRTDNSR